MSFSHVGNFIPQEAFMDVVNTATRKSVDWARRKAGREVPEFDVPPVRFRNFALPYWYIWFNNKAVADDLLAEFPDIYFEVKRGLMTDIDVEHAAAIERGRNVVTKKLHGYFNKQDKLNHTLAKITLAKAQEEWMRDAMVIATLDQISRSQFGRTLKNVLENGDHKIFTEAHMREAADRALRVTAASPITDPAGRAFKQASDFLDKHVTILFNPIWFARFTYTITKGVANSLAWGMIDVSPRFGRGTYDSKSFAKGVMGWGMVGMAYAILRSLGGDDDKWYSLRVPGTDQFIDARRWFPMSAYLFVAHIIDLKLKGKEMPGLGDFAEGFASFESDQYGKSPTSEFIKSILGLEKDSENDTYDQLAARELAVVLGGYLRFFYPFTTLFKQIDSEEAAFRKYGPNPADQFIKEIAKTLPLQHLYGAEKRINPITGKDVKQPYPALRLLGINLIHPDFIRPEKSAGLERAYKLYPTAKTDEAFTQEEKEAYAFRRAVQDAVRTDKVDEKDMDTLVDKYVADGKMTDRSAKLLKKSMRMSELQNVLQRNFSLSDKEDVVKMYELIRKLSPREAWDVRDIVVTKGDNAKGKFAERQKAQTEAADIASAIVKRFGSDGSLSASERQIKDAGDAQGAIKYFEAAPFYEKDYLLRLLKEKKTSTNDAGREAIQKAINDYRQTLR
jgi:hypothetical protein